MIGLSYAARLVILALAYGCAIVFSGPVLARLIPLGMMTFPSDPGLTMFLWKAFVAFCASLALLAIAFALRFRITPLMAFLASLLAVSAEAAALPLALRANVAISLVVAQMLVVAFWPPAMAWLSNYVFQPTHSRSAQMRG